MADTDASDPEAAARAYLSGNYAPVVEEVTAFDLPVEGELPTELEGRYVRNGPNPIGEVDPATHHWFIGDGMVHGVRLGGGQAHWYRNRYVGSARVSEVRGEPDVPGPNWNGSPGGPNTNVAGFAGTTWATVEAGGCPVELTYELETVGRNDFFGTLPGAFTAHPKLDPDRGELHAIVYAWAEWMDHVQYLVVAPDGRVRRTLDIPLPGMTMLHDMSLTGRYAVVYDQPCTVDLDLAFAGRFPFRWNPDYGNRVGLLPRDGEVDDIVWIDVPLGYAFHPMNAYDDGEQVVIDLCSYDAVFDRDLQGPFGEPTLPRLERWVLDPEDADGVGHRGRRVAQRVPSPSRLALVQALPLRLLHVGVRRPDRRLADAQARPDHRRAAGVRPRTGPGRRRTGLRRPRGGADEDDGWIITFVHDLGSESAELVVLDAQEFDRRGYVARVRLPQRVPFGFHGNWISDASVPPPS